MTTIRRNWTKRVAQIRTAARTCRAYDSASGNMVPVDPARAFEAWESTPRAKLTEDAPGQKWTVHVHSNRFYVLTAEDPATAAEPAAPADEAPAPPTTAPGPAQGSLPPHRAAGPATAQDHGPEGAPEGDAIETAAQIATRALAERGVTAHRISARNAHTSWLAIDREQHAGSSPAVDRPHLRLSLYNLDDDGMADMNRPLTTMDNWHLSAVDASGTERLEAVRSGSDLIDFVEYIAAWATGHSSPDEQRATQHHPDSPREVRVRDDSMLSRIDAVLHDAAVTEDFTVSDDAMRSIPLADGGEIIHAYTRAQALADGVLVAADANSAREAGFRVPVALTSAVWEGCVAWNEGDSERQVPQDERGRLWDVLTMCRAAIRRSGGGGGRVSVAVRRVPRDGRTQQPRPVQLVCAIGPGDHGEPVITIMQPDED